MKKSKKSSFKPLTLAPVSETPPPETPLPSPPKDTKNPPRTASGALPPKTPAILSTPPDTAATTTPLAKPEAPSAVELVPPAPETTAPSTSAPEPVVESVRQFHPGVLFGGTLSLASCLLKNRVALLFTLICLALITAVGVSLKLYTDASYKLTQLAITQTSGVVPTPNEAEIKDLVKKVERHAILPTGMPRVITVSNIETLRKEQPFFENAKDGNQLLVYANKVVIYDPQEDRIVDIAYIKPTSATSSATPVAPIRVVLYNGTSKVGLTTVAADKLKGMIPQVEIVGREKAVKTNYETTLVADMTGKHQTTAAKLAKLLGGGVGTLPEGEASLSAQYTPVDIIAILGASYQ